MPESTVNDSSRSNDSVWSDDKRQVTVIARNMGFEYVTIGVNLLLGIVMLPFNVSHLGKSAYGLWVLTTSITTYFSMLELGYGSAQVKFAAQYRAKRDAAAINEITSTLFFLLMGVGTLAYVAAVVLSYNLGTLFNLDPAQAGTGQAILLIVSAYVAMSFPFSVFGGIVNGFQQYYLNNVVSLFTSILVALINVAVIGAGYGVVELVAATTAVRMLCNFAYRWNAYQAFPLLSVQWKHVRKARLREVTGFSAFLLLINIAGKISYSADTVVIGAFLGTAAIAVWAVAQRLIGMIQMLTRQLNDALFPVIVKHATKNRNDRLQIVLLHGTRLSLASVIPMTTVLAMLASPLVTLWVGSGFGGSIPVIYIFACSVSLAVGAMTAGSLLKGGGRHRLLAYTSLAGATANLTLSILLVRQFGLVGIAVGTVIPKAIATLVVLWPASCRRVELSYARLLREAVWPALWPAIPTVIVLLWTRNFSNGWVYLVLNAILGGAIYLAVFTWLAINSHDRNWYFSQVRHLAGRPSVTATV